MSLSSIPQRQSGGWEDDDPSISVRIKNMRLVHPDNKSVIVLQKLLGTGGYGQVWKGVVESIGNLPPSYQTMIGQEVAVKLSKRQKRAKYILTEHYILEKLQNITGVVPVYHELSCYKPNAPMVYIVQKLMMTSLHNVVRKKKLTIRQALSLGLCLLNHIQQIHERGIIHQDIKPDNIMVDQTGMKCDHTYFIDFGGACDNHEDPNELNSCKQVGTPNYMSIRQHIYGGHPVFRDDLETIVYTVIRCTAPEKMPWRKINYYDSDTNQLVYEKKMFGIRNLYDIFKDDYMPFFIMLQEGRQTSVSMPDYSTIRQAFHYALKKKRSVK